MKPTFPIWSQRPCSSEQARLRRQDRWPGIATSSLRQPLRFPPQTNSGALNMPQPLGMPPVNTGAIGITSPSALGVPGQQTFGALPGNPGSATYDPNAALPSLGNSGSAIAPDQGSSATGVNTPSTNVNGGM
jgi:hypothetical protein